jgi:cell volume regulation protein A
VVVGLALTVVARPLSVLVCATPFGVGLREQAFMSWAGLRGAVPIVLATMPITAGLSGGQKIFDVVFLLVVVFTLVQGPTLRRVADRLGVVEAGRTRELSIEHAPFEDLGATMMTLDVPPGSRLAGVEVSELRLPGDSLVTLVVRGDRIFVPKARTVIRTGDQLLLATTNRHRAATERRLRAISREGRLAGWYGEEGLEAPPPPPPARAGPAAHAGGEPVLEHGEASLVREPAGR